jgi:hypothetical protein
MDNQSNQTPRPRGGILGGFIGALVGIGLGLLVALLIVRIPRSGPHAPGGQDYGGLVEGIIATVVGVSLSGVLGAIWGASLTRRR